MEGLGAGESLSLITQTAKSNEVVCSVLAPEQKAECPPDVTAIC